MTKQPKSNGHSSPLVAPALVPDQTIMGPPTALPSPPTSQNGTPATLAVKTPSLPPSDWTVEDVVAWAKSKGFDDSVCEKFVGE